MRADDPSEQGEFTRAIHGGQHPDPAYGAIAQPIYQTSAFAADTLEEAVARSAGLEEGFTYTRMGNPTIAALEGKLAALEGAESCVAFATGMGAVSALFLGICRTGDHVVCSDSLYGATYSLLTGPLTRWGLQVSFVDARETGNIVRAIHPDTRLVYLESPSNPILRLADLEAAAQLAHDRGVLAAVDNTFATSVNQRPLALGIDLVVYSSTKYHGGHGDTLGGAALGSRELLREIRAAEILVGAAQSPLNAFLLLRGLQTLPLRVARHNANALAVARWLAAQPLVRRVHYPGLDSHPQHALAQQQMRGFGGMVSFDVGDDDTAQRVLDAVRLWRLAVSLGDVNSLISLPARMSHRSLSPAQREQAGITPGLIRLSVGLEDADDLVADLEQAFGQASA